MSRSLLACLLLLLPFINQTAHATLAKDPTPWPSADTSDVLTPRGYGPVPVEKRPLFIFAFVHDDIPTSTIDSILPEHFVPMIKELRATTGRNVSVRLIRNTPPYTTYAYKGPTQASYDGWMNLGTQYRDTHNLPVNKTTKFLLLTNDWMNSETLGVAGNGQQFALASLTNRQIVGHELGHTLNAQHEHAEVRYNGWWCETYMAAKINPLLSNCKVYTDVNRQRIKDYLSNTH